MNHKDCNYCLGSGKCQSCDGLGWRNNDNADDCKTCNASGVCKFCGGEKKDDWLEVAYLEFSENLARMTYREAFKKSVLRILLQNKIVTSKE